MPAQSVLRLYYHIASPHWKNIAFLEHSFDWKALTTILSVLGWMLVCTQSIVLYSLVSISLLLRMYMWSMLAYSNKAYKIFLNLYTHTDTNDEIWYCWYQVVTVSINPSGPVFADKWYQGVIFYYSLLLPPIPQGHSSDLPSTLDGPWVE